VVVLPEIENTKRSRNFAEALDAPLAIIEKRRVGNAGHSEILNLIGSVDGCQVVIVDDEIDTGGSITQAAQVCFDHGATEVYASCIHPVFSGPAVERLRTSSITEIVATNVFHRAVAFGRPVAGVPISGVVARVTFNGEPFGEAAPLDATLDPVEVVRLIARTIGTAGERLRPGDTIIGGSLVPPPAVSPGDELALDLGPLGSLSLAFEP